MRKNRPSFLTIVACLVIIFCLIVTLDLAGVIKVPDNLSVKKYLTKSIGTLGKGEKVYYPDYEATGLSAENKVTEDEKNKTVDTKVSGKTVKEGEQVSQEKINELINDVNGAVSNDVITPDYNVTDNSYFYTQLNTYGKTFYSRLYSNLDNLKTGTYSIDFGITFNDLLQTEGGAKTLTDAFQLSINALLLDHPEIFYLDVTKMFMFTESTTTLAGTTYKISIGPDEQGSYLLEGFNSKDDVVAAENDIQKVMNSVVMNSTGTTYEKIVKVHNYLVDNIDYDSSEPATEISHSLYGALVNKKAVCDGYAKAFKYILDNMGISCVEICGNARNSTGSTESHAWNDVLLDGKWYAVDVTWDDPIIIGGNGRLTNDLRYNYFLKGSQNFYETHYEDGFIVENGEFKYPEISDVSYY